MAPPTRTNKQNKTRKRQKQQQKEQEMPQQLKAPPKPIFHQLLADMYNNIFATHTSLPPLLTGTLIALNKPGKSPHAMNTRPITLLNITRKLLSDIVLARITPYIEEYLSPNQSGFRPKRSTSDIIFTYRWLQAIAEKQKHTLDIMGIDMSKAFDCVNRAKLLTILHSILPYDCYRIIQYLLSTTTTLETKINGQ